MNLVMSSSCFCHHFTLNHIISVIWKRQVFTLCVVSILHNLNNINNHKKKEQDVTNMKTEFQKIKIWYSAISRICWNALYYLYESMKVLEIFCFLRIINHYYKVKIWKLSDSESELFKYILNKGQWFQYIQTKSKWISCLYFNFQKSFSLQNGTFATGSPIHLNIKNNKS